MAKDPVVFKSALNGYKKEDVNRYIASMAQEFARRGEEWETEKSKLLRDLENAKSEKEQVESQRDELACQTYSAMEEASKRSEALADAEKNSLELKSTIAGLSARIHAYEVQIADEQASKEAESEEFFRKLSEKADQIMTTASNSANEIVQSALLRGDEIIAEAEKKAEQMMSDAAVRSEAGYYDEVMRFASEIRDSMNKLMCEIGAKKAELDNKLSGIREEKEELPQPEIKSNNKSTFAMIDERIDRFFKSTIDSIAGMAKGKSHTQK